MAIVYPDNLPAPLLDGYALKRQPNLLRTGMASGRSRQRRRFLSVPTRVSASWQMPAEKAELFEGFAEHALGADWFQLQLLTPDGLVLHTVRFITDPREDSTPDGPQSWTYRATLEVEGLP